MVTSTVSATIPLVNSGRVRALAVLARERAATLPQVPTSAEAGMPEVVVSTWYGLFAPAGVKPEIIESLSPRSDKAHALRDNECETWRSDYTERKGGVPQQLLVEQRIPGSQILPRFHDLDQFQVLMDDRGMLGTHSIMPCQRRPPHAGKGSSRKCHANLIFLHGNNAGLYSKISFDPFATSRPYAW